jgi:hypothetical protein
VSSIMIHTQTGGVGFFIREELLARAVLLYRF